MGSGTEDVVVDRSERPRVIPEIRPGRDIGWVFRDGDVVALERVDDHAREHGGERPDPVPGRDAVTPE